MKSYHLVAAVVLGVLGAGGAGADPAAQLDAKLSYLGKTRPLDHVLILRFGNEEGMEDGPRLRIFLSDGEIPLRIAGAATSSRAKAYTQQAGLSAVMITADPAGKDRAAAAALLNVPGMDPQSFATASSSDAFSAFQVAQNRVTGAVSFNNSALQLAAKFEAPVTANPITADLKGKAGLESAPVKALAAYRDALKKADLNTAGKYATAARMQVIREYRAQAGEQAFRDAVTAAAGADLAKAVKRVIVHGATASVVLEGKEIEELVQEGDAWKVD
ncbi:MAG: hypothetical protein NVSMB34_05090 [Variovorax sp.]